MFIKTPHEITFDKHRLYCVILSSFDLHRELGLLQDMQQPMFSSACWGDARIISGDFT